MYTMLYLKRITNKDLLYSTGNSAQCYAAAWMGEGCGGEWIHVYVWLSPSATHLKLSHCLFPLNENSEALECRRLSSFIVKENEQQPDLSNRGATEPLQISQVSLISKDTEPVELNCNFSFSRKRKISCTICGHKFLRKSQLLEHMYTHKGKSYRFNRCQRFGNALAQRFPPYCDSWSDIPLKSSRLSQEQLDSSCVYRMQTGCHFIKGA